MEYTMKYSRIILFTAAMALCIACRASSPIYISVVPDTQLVTVSGSASVDLVISGLSLNVPPTLGGFFFDLTYDPAVLSASSVVFGDKLNSVAGSPQQFADITTPGQIHLDEVSFESILNQPDTFSLATLVFSGLAPGVSSLSFAYADLSDGDGNSIPDFQTVNGSFTVSSSSVPEAATTWPLLLFAVAPLALLRKSMA
jgi:hypothetical protein